MEQEEGESGVNETLYNLHFSPNMRRVKVSLAGRATSVRRKRIGFGRHNYVPKPGRPVHTWNCNVQLGHVDSGVGFPEPSDWPK